MTNKTDCQGLEGHIHTCTPKVEVKPEGLSGLFDNRATNCREGWRNGVVAWYVTADFIEAHPDRDKAPWGTFPDVPANIALICNELEDKGEACKYCHRPECGTTAPYCGTKLETVIRLNGGDHA